MSKSLIVEPFQETADRGTNTEPGKNYEELYKEMVQEKNKYYTQASQLAERYTQLHAAHVKQQQMSSSLQNELQQVKQQVID